MEITEKILYDILAKKESRSKLTIINWIISEDVVKAGENFSSELCRLKVTYQKKRKIYQKNFFLKIPSAHPTYETMKGYHVLDKEYLMYTTVLEEMYRIDGEHIGPKFYYTDDKHSLILKDLLQSGYRSINRVQQLNLNQCGFALRCLAKFHALSVKINQTIGIDSLIKKVSWEKVKEADDKLNPFLRFCYDQFIKNLTDEYRLIFQNKLMKLGTTFIEDTFNEIKYTTFRFNVLNHGDFWTSNILCKFDKYGNIDKVKLVDFQCVCWTSPAFDILVFTITSMQFDVFEKHFDSLLEMYIDTLNQTLMFLHCDPYSLEDLKNDLERLPHLVLHVIVVYLPMFLSDIEDPLNIKTYMTSEGFNLKEMKRFFNNKIYIKKMERWFSYYVEKGLLDLLEQKNENVCKLNDE